ncbi:CUB and sushi domain-containing protein 2-like [Tubulanus polymorphus]|uniref:CUB and sushi domain-containing protein 2-like n=1 Tax=Tubulanus polymorphus TaxID=672921 RepID=UPI003DA2FA55
MIRLWGDSVRKWAFLDFFVAVALSCSFLSRCSTGFKPNDLPRDTGQCGRNLYNASGQITSPGFPNGYKPLVSCEWHIQAPANGWFIQIYFRKFDTDEKTSKSNGDVLRIYDRYISGERDQAKWSFGGIVKKQKILVRSNSVWLLFESDHSTPSPGKGFKLDYKFIKIHDCSDPGQPTWGHRNGDDFRIGAKIQFDCDDGYVLIGAREIECLTANDQSDQPVWNYHTPSCSTPCDSANSSINLSRHKDVILSQDFPNNYSSNHACTWIIQMNETYLNINLTADVFDVSTGDTFQLYRNTTDISPFAVFSGDSPFTGIISESNVLIAKFISSAESSGGHFKLSYTIYSNSSKVCLNPPEAMNMYIGVAKSYYISGDFVQYRCRQGYVLARKNSANTFSTCLGENKWSISDSQLPSCVSHCKRWSFKQNRYEDVILTNQTGVILSPAYPQQMPKGTKCSYAIRANPGQILEIRFEEVVIDNFTTITVFDVKKNVETLLVSLTEISSFGKVYSTSNSVRVSVQKMGGEKQGTFVLTYNAVTSEFCKKPHVEWGTVVLGNNSIGSFAQIRCDSFFRLSGPSSSICTTDGLTNRWHPPLPRCIGQCGGTYHHPSGNVVSPDYPAVYHDTDPCFWSVRLEEGVYSVTVNVLELHQPPGTSLEILSGPYEKQLHGECIIGKACLNITFDMDGNSFQIRLKPGFNAEGIIFKLFYSTTLKYRPPKFCPLIDTQGGFLQIDNQLVKEGTGVKLNCHQPFDLIGSQKISCTKNKLNALEWIPPPPICEIRCLPGGIERNTAGMIASPGYPNNVTPGTHSCTWLIHATPGLFVALSFRYVNIPPPLGNENYIKIYDVFGGKERLPGRIVNAASNVISTSSVVKIEVNLNVKQSGRYKGFLIDYDFVHPPQTTTPKSSTTSTVQITNIPGEIVTSSTKMKDRVSSLKNVHNPARPNVPMIIGVIFGTVLVVVLILAFVYFWYRKRYPVRLVIGRKIEKYSNPIYDRSVSTISTMSLYRGPDGVTLGGNRTSELGDSCEGLDNLAFQISNEENANTSNFREDKVSPKTASATEDNSLSRLEDTISDEVCVDQIDVNANNPPETRGRNRTVRHYTSAGSNPPNTETDDTENPSLPEPRCDPSISHSSSTPQTEAAGNTIHARTVPTITLTPPDDQRDILEAQV